MKRSRVFIVGIVFLLAFFKAALAADKIGSVDVGRLFDEYQKTKDFDKGLEQRVSSYEKERDGMVSEIKQMQDKLAMLAEKEKEKKEKEIEDKMKSARDFAASKENDLKKERNDKLKEVFKDIEAVVSQYAQKEGYTMIFDDRVFLYNNKTNDITNKVLEILQVNYKKGAADTREKAK